MTKEDFKQNCVNIIDNNKEAIIAIGDEIFAHPELGFKEKHTAALVRQTLEDLGIPNQDHLALTGVKGNLKGRRSDLRVMVMGELDAVICPLHPQADLQTGAAHSCGHNSQIAAMVPRRSTAGSRALSEAVSRRSGVTSCTDNSPVLNF